MLLIAHRGHHHAVPENTLSAFEKAIEFGVHGIETDIRRSRDGEALLFHDRVAAGQEVSSLTRAELSDLVGYPVPSLEEALDAFDDILWVLEVKSRGAIDGVVSALRDRRCAARCMVISFWHDVVDTILDRVPVQGGLLLSHRPLDCGSSILSQTLRSSIRHIVWNYEFLDARVTEQTAERGYVNLVYGPESREEHAHCAKIGVDAVITDYPERLLTTFSREVERSASTAEFVRVAEAAH